MVARGGQLAEIEEAKAQSKPGKASDPAAGLCCADGRPDGHNGRFGGFRVGDRFYLLRHFIHRLFSICCEIRRTMAEL